MNSWKFNSIIGHLIRQAIVKKLNINHTEIYKIVKSIDDKGVIKTQDGKKYILKLKELKNESKI
jgi:sugar-specific transcriptional regulator TrmB